MAAALVLASASQSRASLLRAAGLDFQVDPALVDEDEIKRGMSAEAAPAADTAMALAEIKVLRISPRHPEAITLAADQILECDGEWYAKPRDAADARDQLLRLRGRRHYLRTAAVCAQGGSVIWRQLDSPALTMRAFSESFINSYVQACGAGIVETVGSYRLEGLGVQLFSDVRGDFFSILGLPLLPLLGFLREHGVVAT